MDTRKRVAVIGAGPMGLAAAYQLAKDGHRPVVFEGGPTVGGMTATFDFDGTVIERFYHFHCTSDVDYFTMLDELGIADRLRWTQTKMGFWYGGRVQPWGDPMALLRFRGLGLVSKLRYGLHVFTSIRRNRWDRLDRLDGPTWVRRWVGRRAYEVLWSKLFDLKFYDLSSDVSAAWIWSRIRRVGRSRDGLFVERLGALEGGSQTFLNALVAAIESHGGRVRLSTPVRRVLIEDDETKGVELDRDSENFDTVISTVPLPFVPRIMPDLPNEIRARYEALQNIAVVCVIVKLRRSLTENFWLNINDPEMDIPGLVEYSHVRDLDVTVVYVPFYMPGDHPKFQESDETFCTKVRGYLQRINPDLTEDDFLAIRASRYRFAQPVCTPHFLDSLPSWDLPIRGLYVADTSYYYPEDRGISESVGFGRMLAVEAMK